MTPEDTIVAVATAPGRAAIGVVRVSGPKVPSLAAVMLGALPQPRTARRKRFRDARGETLDEGLALYFPAPGSYTGEHVLELHGHGGALVIDLVVRSLLELGCRMARPGEFSERAFLNGKMDMAQAEAVADLIEAGSAAAARAALRSMRGEFSARIGALAQDIVSLRTHVEAAIDFPDEDLELLRAEALGPRLAGLFEAFDAIAAAARQGALLREGMSVTLAGPPNAGKSSLMNRLAGDEIAIVTEMPGTTRDVLRQRVHLDGMPLNLADTAGLRESADAIENEGVRRARSEIARSDRVLYVLDASAGAPGPRADATQIAGELERAALPEGVPVTLVLNKVDLTGEAARLEDEVEPPRVYVSARTGAGLDLLRRHLKSSMGYVEGEAGAFAARRRHLDALRRAREHVESGASALTERRAFELIAEDLRLAHRALGEITGEFTSEDLLGEIFGSFCVGK